MKYIKKTGVESISYTPEEREKALSISLTALASHLGYTPLRAGSHYYLKEMDSLVIYNDRSWNRWSGKGNITGGTQIDFMLEYGGAASVPEAVMKLLDFSGEGMAAAAPTALDEKRSQNSNDGYSMSLPPKNGNFRRMYAYLIQTRGLSQEVVSDFVHRRLIYEDSVHHNIVYCGRDPEGNIRYAGLRGTGDIYGKAFKMDVPGNNKNYGVNIVNEESDELKVFESVIDCMSYIDMYKDNRSNKLILGMVEDNPLVQFLKDYSHIRKISFCLDNDAAGQISLYGQPEASDPLRKEGLIKKYEDQGYAVDVIVPPIGKDFNESLIELKKIKDACIQAMQLRGYEHIENIDGKIAFRRRDDKQNHGDTAGWVFQYNDWLEVRESLLEPPLWEKKELTQQIDQLIGTTEKEKCMRASDTEMEAQSIANFQHRKRGR